MALVVGARLGPYEVLSALGAGGMGEVYKARDTKLGREVALKILPEAFALDADRIARFKREAQVLASLNHPNIGAIYGFEDGDGVHALVLELVDGPTLADRISQGPVPLDEALTIATQIAEALEAAHEQGIIHRDLKPANIKVRDDGAVKVLDFGLARLAEPAAVAGTATMTQSPTITTPAMTAVGLILGTAAYMSPEQAKGRQADKRSDIWAFGCVLYEMLTGKRPFEGEDISETLAAVLRAEPDWTALSAATPEALRRLLRRCLAKDRRSRIADASIARIEIDEALTTSNVAPEQLRNVSHRHIHLIWASIVTVLVMAAGGELIWALRPSSAPPEMRLEIATPPTTDVTSLAISPDGRKIVFSAEVEGRSQLLLRSLDSGSTRPLVGTWLATRPFWSPDSRSIGFFADGKLKRLEIDGGSPQVLASAGLGMGGAWMPDSSILFVPNAAGTPILRLPASGGEPVPVTRLTSQQLSHRSPQLLPDGRHFTYYVAGPPEVAGIYLGQLGDFEARRLVDAGAAVYAASGHLLFIRQGALYAQGFDLRRFDRVGTPHLVSEQVAIATTGTAALSASAAGPIVYRTGLAGQRQFAWFDRSGREIRHVGSPDGETPRAPAMSPDGSRVALTRITTSNSDIWLLDTTKGLLTRFTADERGSYPIWSADGKQIAFSSTKGSDANIHIKPVTRVGTSDVLYSAPGFSNPTDWSRDGQFLLFRHADPGKTNDIWVLPMSGDRKAFPIVQTNFDERDGQFSPDGNWIAYQSDESGQFEVYVQKFPVSAGKERVSTNGGAQVRWRSDGKELFYIALDNRLMAAPIVFTADGANVDAGSPVPLFTTRIGGAVQGVARQQYVVSPDGQRFLMNTVPEESAAPITILLNWTEELKQRVPTR
jgi:serine/threonine protein kinase